MTEEAVRGLLTREYAWTPDRLTFLREGGNLTWKAEKGEEARFLRQVRPAFADTAKNGALWQKALGEAGIAVPRLVPGRDGLPYTETREEEPLLWTLSQWLEGEDSQPARDAEAAGRLTGALHRTAGVIDLPLVPREADYYLGRYLRQLQALNRPEYAAFASMADTLWDSVKHLPRGFCHGDLYCGNVYGTPGSLYLLDFDTVGRGFPIYDAVLYCNATDYFTFRPEGREETRALWERFLPAYRRECPVSPGEEAALEPLIGIYHYQCQATILSLYGLDCVPPAFFARQLDWLQKWEAQCGGFTKNRF